MANPNPVTRFQAGNQHGGRTKGARARLSDKFFTALSADFDERAEVVIAAVRENDPSTYLNIVARLMPKELEARLQIEQRLPGNLDAESYGTLRRVVELIERYAPAGAEPGEVFETVEAALIRAFEAPKPLQIEHRPALAMDAIEHVPVTVSLPPPPYLQNS
jgi:hypothetical protein